MRAPEPNEEQYKAAKAFCENRPPFCPSCGVDDDVKEQNAALREQVATLTAHAAALEMNETYWIGEVDHLRATIATLTEWKAKRLHDEAKSQEMIERLQQQLDVTRTDLSLAWADCHDGSCRACAKCFDLVSAATHEGEMAAAENERRLRADVERLTAELKESDDTVTRLSDLLDVRDATIRGLTKERDEAKASEAKMWEVTKDADKFSGEMMEKNKARLAENTRLIDDNARHLAAIETLREHLADSTDALWKVAGTLQDRAEAQCARNTTVLDTTIDYAKKADEG